MFICFHKFPIAWEVEGDYFPVDFEDLILTRYVQECSKCGKKRYYKGKLRFKSDGRTVY